MKQDIFSKHLAASLAFNFNHTKKGAQKLADEAAKVAVELGVIEATPVAPVAPECEVAK